MKYSVIIPAYNAEKYLSKGMSWLESVDRNDVEVIIVDDGSKDGTYECCKRIESHYPNIVRTVTKSNGGPSSARNMGIDLAKGEWITFFDADDIISGEVIDIFDQAISSNDSDLHVFAFTVNTDRMVETIPCATRTYSVANIYEYIEEEVVSKKYGNGWLWNKLYRRELIRDQRLNTNILLMEDELFNLEYLKNCRSIAVHNTSYYTYYIQNQGSIRERELVNHFYILELVFEGFNEVYSLFQPDYEKKRRFEQLLTGKMTGNFLFSIYKHLFRQDNLTKKVRTDEVRKISDSKLFKSIYENRSNFGLELYMYTVLLRNRHTGLLHLAVSLAKILRQIKNKIDPSR